MILRFAVLATLSGGIAHGKASTEVVVVGVHVEGLESDAATAAVDALVRQIGKVPGFSSVGPEEAQARIRGRGTRIVDDALLSRGRALLAEGQVLFQHADLEAAVDRITEAVDAFDDAMVGSTDTQELQEALLVRGMTSLAMGDLESARASFGRVVQMDSDRELGSVHYPPKVVVLFEDVREHLLESPLGALDLRLNLPDASVYVDGQHRGKGSMIVRDVVPGWHHVLVTTDSGLRSHARVEVVSQERTVVDVAPPWRFIGVPEEDPSMRSEQIGQLYRAVGDQVTDGLILLAGQIGTSQVGLQVYEPRTGNFSMAIEGAVGPIPAASIVALSGRIGELQSPSGTLPADQVALEALPLDISTNPVLSRVLLDRTTRVPPPPPAVVNQPQPIPWMVWAGVGVGVMGATVAAILLSGSKGGADTPLPDQTGTVVVTF